MRLSLPPACNGESGQRRSSPALASRTTDVNRLLSGQFAPLPQRFFGLGLRFVSHSDHASGSFGADCLRPPDALPRLALAGRLFGPSRPGSQCPGYASEMARRDEVSRSRQQGPLLAPALKPRPSPSRPIAGSLTACRSDSVPCRSCPAVSYKHA